MSARGRWAREGFEISSCSALRFLVLRRQFCPVRSTSLQLHVHQFRSALTSYVRSQGDIQHPIRLSSVRVNPCCACRTGERPQGSLHDFDSVQHDGSSDLATSPLSSDDAPQQAARSNMETGSQSPIVAPRREASPVFNERDWPMLNKFFNSMSSKK